jgi:soluble lytic murein transglycosylase-like protein
MTHFTWHRANWPRWCALVWGLALAWGAPAGAAIDTQSLREEARALEHGEGRARDIPAAIALYCKAAFAGDAESAYNLGWIYTNGRGTDRNDSHAAFLLGKAVQAGDQPAKRLLARLGPEASPPPCWVALETQEAERQRQLAQAAAEARALEEARLAEERARNAYLGLIQTPSQKQILGLVHKWAPRYGIEPGLAVAIIKAESNFDPQAVSEKNAQGLMQLIPETADRFGVRKPFDAEQNIKGGLSYLRWLMAYFEGRVALVAAAYNAGEGAVERHKGVPPYEETQRYVQRIKGIFAFDKHPFDPKVTGPSPELNRILLSQKP